MIFPIAEHLRVDPVCRLPQSQYPQRDQIAGAEKMPGGFLCLLRHVNFAFPEAKQKFLRRQINQLNFIRVLKNGVGQGFPNLDAGNLVDVVVQAFQMLHVDRGINV